MDHSEALTRTTRALVALLLGGAAMLAFSSLHLFRAQPAQESVTQPRGELAAAPDAVPSTTKTAADTRSPEPAPPRAPSTPEPDEEVARADAPVHTPIDTSDPRALALTFAEGRRNAFFNERRFVAAASQDRALPRALLAELSITTSLSSLPADVRFMRDAPTEVLERMAMLDLLGGIADETPDGIDALVELALSPIPDDLPPQAIRVLVGEKYDAILELARLDWPTAASTFRDLDGAELRRVVLPALVNGLEANGVEREEALRMAEAL